MAPQHEGRGDQCQAGKGQFSKGGGRDTGREQCEMQTAFKEGKTDSQQTPESK